MIRLNGVVIVRITSLVWKNCLALEKTYIEILTTQTKNYPEGFCTWLIEKTQTI